MDESESTGRFAALVPSPFGAGSASVSHRSLGSSEEQREVDITVPYRFQELIRQVKERTGVALPERDGDKPEYGDVVAVEGVVSPMSLFRFEIAQDAVITLTNAAIAARKQNDKFQSVVESHGLSGEIEGSEEPNEAKAEEPMDIQEARADVTSAFVDISEAITGDGVPIRIDGKHGFEGNSYAAVLDRTQLRVPTERAFYKPRKYTIFGRVEEQVPEGSQWDPVDTTRVADSFASEDIGIDEFFEVIVEVAESNEIEMRDEHITIDGPATIIDPLAVYW
jgi:hypothetical protein